MTAKITVRGLETSVLIFILLKSKLVAKRFSTEW